MRLVIVCLLLSAAVPLPGIGSEVVQLEHVEVDVTNQMALQRGAKYFVNYCMGCHSAKYTRYNQLAPGLGLSDKEIRDNLIFGDASVGDPMATAMPADYAKQCFGIAPPDLTNIVGIRGADWVYTYLKSFYRDASRPFGVNNLVFKDVAMPNVLWQLQGPQAPVYEKSEAETHQLHQTPIGVKSLKPGTMSPEEFAAIDRDLVTFLAYISEPHRQASHLIGKWVILLLIIFTVLAYFLKREYWKDVK
jgi:ubiquinol-cytochrome c reductase cytochrome c1 subunit